MIITALADQVAYRMHTPRWAYLPTSGAGAAKQGGRLNRQGIDALYLSYEMETAAAEYQQLGGLLPPGTLVTYQVTLDRVADFSAGYSKDWDPLWQDLLCDWRDLAFNQKVEPPSWVLGDLCLEAGCKGLIFGSAIRPRGLNLVVFTGTLGADDRLEVYDPKGDLPKDASSWPRGHLGAGSTTPGLCAAACVPGGANRCSTVEQPVDEAVASHHTINRQAARFPVGSHLP